MDSRRIGYREKLAELVLVSENSYWSGPKKELKLFLANCVVVLMAGLCLTITDTSERSKETIGRRGDTSSVLQGLQSPGLVQVQV